jgi:ElaB/YqjD/DUF883 family membrane-anchored ribosome-binding protein
MDMRSFLPAALAAVVVLSGCSKDTRVTLKVTVNGEEGPEPATSVKFDLLPYDIEAIRDSLRVVNAPPAEPSREELLALRAAYEEINKEYNAHLEEYRAAEAGVKGQKDFTSNAYKAAYKRYTDAKAKNATLNERREKARSEYIAVKKQYDRDLEAWEEQAYAGMDEVISRIREARGITEDYLIKTDKEGVGRVTVPGGKWWANGRERHPGRKYTWLIWNVPFEAAGGDLELELTESDARVWTE